MAELKLNIVAGGLNKIKKSLENINIGGGTVAKSGGGGGALKSVAILGGIFGILVGIFGSIESITGLLSIIGGLINALVAPFVPILIGLLKPFLLLFQVVGGLLLKFFQDPVGALSGLFDNIAGVVGNLIGLDPEQINVFVTNFKAVLAQIGDLFSNVGTFFKQLFEGDLAGAFKTLGPILKGLWNILRGVFVLGFQVLSSILKNVFVGVGKFLFNALIGVGKFFGNIFTTIFQTIGAFFGNILEVVGKIFSGVKTGFVSIFNNILKFFSNAFTSFGNAFIRGLNFLIGLLNKLPGINLGTLGTSSGSVGSNQININIEGSADQNTVNAVITQLRSELTRRGSF